MLDMWSKLPCDMKLEMHHVFGALTLIWRLLDDDRPTSYSYNEVLGAAPHHGSFLAYDLGGRSPSSHFPLHSSLYVAVNDLPMLIFLPTLPPSPLVLAIDLPPPPPPPLYPSHVSRASSSTDPPPLPPHVSLV